MINLKQSSIVHADIVLPPRPRLYEYVNSCHFSSECWTQDVSYFAVRPVLSVCALEALNFFITLFGAEYWTRFAFKPTFEITYL